MYSFWSPSEQVGSLFSDFNNCSTPVTPIPHISHYISDATSDASAMQSSTSSMSPSPMVTSDDTTPLMASPGPGRRTLTLYGQSFTRDLSVWFGNVPSPRTEFRSPEVLRCELPDPSMWFNNDGESFVVQQDILKVPLILVRGDGVVYRTRHWFDLGPTVKMQSMHQGSNAGDQSRTTA
jgi:hypothetical protein